MTTARLGFATPGGDALGGLGVHGHRSTGSWLGSALTEASGIDYLGLLDTGHRRRRLHEQLRVAASQESLASVPTWHLANIITAGRLLTSG